MRVIERALSRHSRLRMPGAARKSGQHLSAFPRYKMRIESEVRDGRGTTAIDRLRPGTRRAADREWPRERRELTTEARSDTAATENADTREARRFCVPHGRVAHS